MTGAPQPSAVPSRTDGRPKRHGRWSRLCLKELRETLRDRRTLITLVLMPLLVYPVLSMVFQRSLMSTLDTQAPKVLIGVTNDKISVHLLEQLSIAEQYIDQEKELNAALARESQTQESETENQTPEEDIAAKLISRMTQQLKVEHLNFRATDNLEATVLEGRLDLGILAPHETKSRRFELIYRDGSTISQNALNYVEERLLILNEMSFRQRLSDAGMSAEIARRVIRRPLQVEKQTSALSTIIPMILILMTVTGAVYPAIDLTAGERERGTLEMLMASPVPRFRLLLAKYVAVVTVAFLTALVNLTAMMITLWATGLSEMLLGEAGLGPIRILQILALLVLFAAFFSAVLLSLTSFARSFKEAQAYLVPLMLLSLGPGVVSLLPGLELNGLLAITPISNIVLLARDLCGGTVNPIMASAAILSTGLYTLAALGVAAKIFGTDAVMSGSNPTLKGLLRDEVDGRIINEHRVSTVSGALLCLAVLFPIYFVLLSGLGKLSGFPMAIRLAVSGIATSFLFGVIPLVAARLQRLDLKHSFQLLSSPLAAFTTALMLGFTVWPIVLLCVQKLTPISADKLEVGKALLSEMGTVHPALILVSMAIIPAIFEELFFRGYLFSALRAATNAKTTIIVSAVLFGVFHVVSSSALTIERLLPSTIMGLILGWLCYRCKSVFPGILLHACHNGLLTMMAYYKDDLAKLGLGMDAQSEIPAGLLIASGVSIFVGLLIIAYLPKRDIVT